MQPAEIIRYLTPLIIAVVIGMAIIPLMARLAPKLRLLDRPSARKVHAVPIPRVGGIGIVCGSLLSIALLIPLDSLINAYIIGAIVLFLFGLWDDRREIGHYVKFIGQFVAALVVVWYGGLYVTLFPFVPGGEIPAAIGMPFTVIAIMGVINAINHSDGLDGLAGGESLISLIAIAFLCFLVGSSEGVIIALAVIGGILAFLRYNTHPATVFMGDSGSQFLGFTLAFLVILLTQRLNQDLSPAVVLLLLGLPITDILAVLVKRARSGMHWFRASRNHIHHRLLDMKFVHQESVIVIYSFQILCVTLGVLLRYESNALLTFVYVLLCGGLLVWISHAEKTGWRKKSSSSQSALLASVHHAQIRRMLVVAPRKFMAFGVPIYFVGAALLIESVPRDFAAMSALIAILLVLELFFGRDPRSIMRRAFIYVTAVFVVYLGLNRPSAMMEMAEPVFSVFFVLLALSFVLAVKFSPRRRKVEFKTTAMDYLVIAVLVSSFIASRGEIWGEQAILFAVQIIIVFYACELLVTENRERWNKLTIASLIAVLVLGARGLI